MDQRDRDGDADDGIVSEDITQLVEHIELTGPQRLIDAPGWERATPAADFDEAPFLIEEGEPEIPDLDAMGVVEDLELFTETQFDIGRHLPSGGLRPEPAAELAAERARWQQRVHRLQQDIEERDQLLDERARRIEELSARLAMSSLEREGLAAGLVDLETSLPDIEGTPEPVAEVESVPAAAAEPVAMAAAETAAVAEAPAAPIENTQELPGIVMPRATPAPSTDSSLRVRRYLIGVDLVGEVHEVTRHRVNIGRTHDNDLRIVDPAVSRLHAMLTLRGGDATVVDANSKNGVFVNGIQVRYAKLEDGDLLTFGTVRFRYRVGSGAVGGPVGVA